MLFIEIEELIGMKAKAWRLRDQQDIIELDLWYRALRSDFGIEIKVSNTDRAIARLYAARRNSMDLDLEKISICRSSAPGTLWLVRKK